MITTCLINSPNLKVYKHTGNEGSRNDPYFWTRYEIHTPTGNLKVQEGCLSTWVYRDDVKRNLYSIGDEDGVRRSRVDAYVVKACGYTIEQLERFSRKARARCKCGCKHFEEIEGYPGESVLACLKCSRIAYTEFNVGAVA